MLTNTLYLVKCLYCTVQVLHTFSCVCVCVNDTQGIRVLKYTSTKYLYMRQLFSKKSSALDNEKSNAFKRWIATRRLRGHSGREAESAAGARVDADSALLDRAAELALGDAQAARALLAARAAPPVRSHSLSNCLQPLIIESYSTSSTI